MSLTFNPRHRNRSNLTVISWNTNGIRSRIEEFRSFIADWNPDIVNLQETHLQPCHNFTFPEYNIYRNDRTFRGGGTAIMVKRSIPHHQILINNNSLETTAIKLTRQDDEPITIISAYRPPRKPLPEQDLHRIFRSQGYVLVAGDLNAKHVSWSPLTQQNVPGTTIRRFCDNTGYALVAPSEPTRFHRNCRNTTIDIAICKGMTVSECTSIPELSSDHNPVLFEVSLDNFTSPALSTYSFPNWYKFQDLLTNSLPGNPRISNPEDIENAIKNFNDCYNSALSHSSTFKCINKPLFSIPPLIRDKIKSKNRIRKAWQITKNPLLKSQLNRLQKDIKKDLNHLKNEKWNNMLSEATPDDDSLYKLVKSVSKNKTFPIPPLVGPMGLHYSPEDKVDLFADSLESSFQENPEPYDDDFIDHVEEKVDRFLHRNARRHTAPLTSPHEIMNIILQLPNKKAPGKDGIKNIALKALPLNAITNITKIINSCLQLNYFPQEWKHALITVIPKPGKDKRFPENYRPISSIGKIFEKILLKKINSHCEENNIIPDFQHGFRQQTSTQHQLLRVTNHIINGYNNRTYTVGLFLDVKKAFDRMWHDGLIYKMIIFNFPTYLIKIIHSYLEN
ncbi:probable RNA-directed DNA polymerase from transposon X-element [Trichonephila clavipes]|nr:probable RNA-directed DNA polymerase from transposon X-element [Trichonephila clavipes]